MKSLFSRDSRSDLLIGGIAIGCLLLSSNFMNSFMPSSLVMVVVALFVAAIALFAIGIWRESPRDEREAQIILTSDRLAFLTGAILLSLGLVYQSIRHQSTDLIAIILSTMIIAKLIGKYVHK